MTQRYELERGLHSFRTDVVLGARTRSGLVDGLAGEHAEGDRDRQGCGELGQGPGYRVGEDIEMSGLTSDQAAERDDRIEAARAGDRRDRRWQLERAGDLELLHLCACRDGHLDRALGERPGDLVVPAGADDRHTRTGIGILSPRRSLPTGRHMPQSSPQMHLCPVTG